MKCNMRCFECPLKDCDNDTLTIEDYQLSISLDKDIIRDETPNEVLRRRSISLSWYYRNRDSELERLAKYREENRERLREEAKQYYADHKEQVNQRHLANYYSNYEENKKKARESKKARYQANKELYRQKQREYRQRVKERRALQNGSDKGQQTTLILFNN